MAELQEMLSQGDVQKVTWLPSKALLADLLTKKGVCSDAVLDCFNSGSLGDLI